MAITLFLVRTPDRPFTWGILQGRFGELLAVRGPRVTAASLVEDDAGADAAPAAPPPAGAPRAARPEPGSGASGDLARYVTGPAATAARLAEEFGGGAPALTVPLVVGERRAIRLESDGVAIADVKRYTTIERMGGYVQLRPNCGSFRTKKDGPYEVVFEPGNPAVKHLYQGKDRQGRWTGQQVHDGNCLRIRGGVTEKERGILIHEASNVSWLTGCISPRTLNNTQTELESRPRTNESYTAMAELFQFLGSETANFFVLDW